MLGNHTAFCNKDTLRVCLVYWMKITIGIVIFIISNKVRCNIITKFIH